VRYKSGISKKDSYIVSCPHKISLCLLSHASTHKHEKCRARLMQYVHRQVWCRSPSVASPPVVGSSQVGYRAYSSAPVSTTTASSHCATLPLLLLPHLLHVTWTGANPERSWISISALILGLGINAFSNKSAEGNLGRGPRRCESVPWAVWWRRKRSTESLLRCTSFYWHCGLSQHT